MAKTDSAHRKLAEQFASRQVKKRYIALVHGWLKKDSGTIKLPISRDRVRRIRMTTRGTGGRDAVSHYKVVRRIDSRFGQFSLLELKIDTGRTHQIRVHVSALGHPVAGDTIYGAPRKFAASPPIPRTAACHKTLKKIAHQPEEPDMPGLERNFLHATSLSFVHPRTKKELTFEQPLPPELQNLLDLLEK